MRTARFVKILGLWFAVAPDGPGTPLRRLSPPLAPRDAIASVARRSYALGREGVQIPFLRDPDARGSGRRLRLDPYPIDRRGSGRPIVFWSRTTPSRPLTTSSPPPDCWSTRRAASLGLGLGPELLLLARHLPTPTGLRSHGHSRHVLLLRDWPRIR